MEKLSTVFDIYNLNARVKPALLSVFPLIASILVWYPEARTMYSVVSGGLVTSGVIAFLANRVASTGRKKEPNLFGEWGGIPTTILLRHRDRTIDNYTKLRYHQWLNENVPNLVMPTKMEEESNPDDADQKYESAVRFLRSKIRDKTTYPLVFTENINYGFSRNLWAAKPIGVILALVTLAGNSGLLWFKHLQFVKRDFTHIIQAIPVEGALVWGVSLLSVIIWVVWVRKEWVKTRAYAYARALLEVCES